MIRAITEQAAERPRVTAALPPAPCFGVSPELLAREHTLVLAAELGPEVDGWYTTYRRVGHRTRYLWQWCVHGADLTTLPGVLPELRRHVCDTKVLSIMLCVLLDDCADEQDNEPLLEALFNVLHPRLRLGLEGFTGIEREYLDVTRELCDLYDGRVREYPCYEVFEHLLRYDLQQYFNTMRFSHLVNRQLGLLNPAEHDLYLPHAMHMMSFSTLDLMCAPNFEINELGRLREVVWYAQCMGRMGNLLSTWRREIPARDFSSGVFARAVTQGDVTVEQLRHGNPEEIEAAIVRGGHEQYYFERWRHYRECLEARVGNVRSLDLTPLVESQERFFYMHLAGRGRI